MIKTLPYFPETRKYHDSNVILEAERVWP